MTTFLFLNLNWMVALSFAGFRKAIKWIRISKLQNCWWIIIHPTRFWHMLFYNLLDQRQVWIKCLSKRIDKVTVSHLFILCINSGVVTFAWLIDPSVCGIYCPTCMQMTVNDNSIIPDIQHWLTATAVWLAVLQFIAGVITILYGQVMTYGHAWIVMSRYIAPGIHPTSTQGSCCIWTQPMRDDVTL